MDQSLAIFVHHVRTQRPNSAAINGKRRLRPFQKYLRRLNTPLDSLDITILGKPINYRCGHYYLLEEFFSRKGPGGGRR